MRVLLDGHMLGRAEGGNERYVKGLIDGFSSLKRVNLKVYRSSKRGILADLRRVFLDLPREAAKFKADIVHSTYIGPLWGKGKLVLIVHDFLFKRDPGYFSLKERLMFKLLLPVCLRRASAVMVPSNFVKKEGIKFYPWLRGKTSVTYEAADKVFSKKLKAKRKPFILGFTSKNPKKNTKRLLEAYGLVNEEFPHLDLVVVGPGFEEQVSDIRLNRLYRTSKCLVYPSLYEGFGLPILEAFTAGTPVIASDIPVFREIAAGAALYVNPKDPKDIAGKIIKLVKSPAVARGLVRKGRKKVKAFSWRQTATETLKVYERVAG